MAKVGLAKLGFDARASASECSYGIPRVLQHSQLLGLRVPAQNSAMLTANVELRASRKESRFARVCVPIALSSCAGELTLVTNALRHEVASSLFGEPAAQPACVRIGNNVPCEA